MARIGGLCRIRNGARLDSMKPILFNTEMVRAILNGRKSVTRRAIKPRYKEDEGGFQVCTNMKTGEQWVEKSDWDEGSFDPPRYIKPPYMPGDILYVRETWAKQQGLYWHKAGLEIDEDGRAYGVVPPDYWRPSIHMPMEAARIFLRVTDVRVKRLQDMTNEDAEREGALTDERLTIEEEAGLVGLPTSTLREYFGRRIWDKTIKKKDLQQYSWEANPWVWVIEFERVEGSVSRRNDD